MFYLQDVLKKTKGARRLPSLVPSSDEDLVFVEDLPETGLPIMLDTCAILDGIRGKAPLRLRDLVEVSTIYHLKIDAAHKTSKFRSRRVHFVQGGAASGK